MAKGEIQGAPGSVKSGMSGNEIVRQAHKVHRFMIGELKNSRRFHFLAKEADEQTAKEHNENPSGGANPSGGGGATSKKTGLEKGEKEGKRGGDSSCGNLAFVLGTILFVLGFLACFFKKDWVEWANETILGRKKRAISTADRAVKEGDEGSDEEEEEDEEEVAVVGVEDDRLMLTE